MFKLNVQRWSLHAPPLNAYVNLYDWTFINGGVAWVGDEAAETGMEGAAEASV